MRMRRSACAAVIAASVLLVTLQSGPAFASDELNRAAVSSSEGPASSLRDHYDGIFVAGEPTMTTSGSEATFFALPESAKNSLIVMPEVARDLGVGVGAVPKADEARVFEELAEMQSPPQVSRHGVAENSLASQMSTASNWTYFWAPTGGGWSPEIRRNTSFIGSNGKYYDWRIGPGSSTQVCAQGVGYYQGYNGSTMGIWRTWYGLGCGQSQYGVRVPWANVSAYPEFKAQSINFWGGPGEFQ